MGASQVADFEGLRGQMARRYRALAAPALRLMDIAARREADGDSTGGRRAGRLGQYQPVASMPVSASNASVLINSSVTGIDLPAMVLLCWSRLPTGIRSLTSG